MMSTHVTKKTGFPPGFQPETLKVSEIRILKGSGRCIILTNLLSYIWIKHYYAINKSFNAFCEYKCFHIYGTGIKAQREILDFNRRPAIVETFFNQIR